MAARQGPRRPGQSKTPAQEELLWAEVVRQLDASGPALAKQLGPPPEHEKIDANTEMAMWNWELTPERVQQAGQNPVIQAAIDAIRPIAEGLLQQGGEDEALALTRFPFRYALYTSRGGPTAKGQVEYAERMARKSGHWPVPSDQAPAATGAASPPVPAPAPVAPEPDTAPAPGPVPPIQPMEASGGVLG